MTCLTTSQALRAVPVRIGTPGRLYPRAPFKARTKQPAQPQLRKTHSPRHMDRSLSRWVAEIAVCACARVCVCARLLLIDALIFASYLTHTHTLSPPLHTHPSIISSEEEEDAVPRLSSSIVGAERCAVIGGVHPACAAFSLEQAV